MDTKTISENFYFDKYHFLTKKNGNSFINNPFIDGLKLGLDFAKWVDSEEKFIKKQKGYSIMDIDSETLDLEDMFEYYVDNVLKI
jgi:hypothetical protein